MPITHQYKRIPLASIVVLRDERQRRELETEDLEASISTHGVLSPIVVEDLGDGTFQLIFGERRLTACNRLGHTDIPCRVAKDLSPLERQIIELEENIRRKGLFWKDEAAAILKVHRMHQELDPTHTTEATASILGRSKAFVVEACIVGEALATGNSKIAEAAGIGQAYHIIARHEARRADNAMNELLEGKPPGPAPSPAQTQTHSFTQPSPTPKPPPPLPESILNENFFTWAQNYEGRPFNFIHCDFPYGINIDQSVQSKISSYGLYSDTEEQYWALCSTLVKNLDRLMSQSAHLMFWLPNDITRQYDTLEYFAEQAPSLVFQTMPLVWHKTDGKGILSDHNRRPRNVVETALIAARGDRFIIKAVANAYGSPTTKEVHQSEKPEPMLRHFFQMFVDEHARVLDPTCGSGSALRAAESLGAEYVLGLEIDEDFLTPARTLLRRSRNLRNASALVSA